MISENEFPKCDILENINGTYLLQHQVEDTIASDYPYLRNEFVVSDLVKDKDKELLKNRKLEKLTIIYDGESSIIFRLSDGDIASEFTYKCERKDDYLEVYFTKRRIWALPLFMNYKYDRLRLGLDANSNLIIHKWYTTLATLTIMPFDSFGGKDYTQTLTRIAP